MAFGTLYWELCGSFFLTVPFLTESLRLFGVIGFWAMHTSFTLGISLSYYPMMTFVALLPPLFWDFFFETRLFLKISEALHHHDAIFKQVTQKIVQWLKDDESPRIKPLSRGAERVLAVFAQIGRILSVGWKIMLILLLVIVIMSNLSTAGVKSLGPPKALLWLRGLFRLEQNWQVFTHPKEVSENYVFVATRKDGSTVELNQNGALFRFEPNLNVSFEPPANYHTNYGSDDRWCQYLIAMQQTKNGEYVQRSFGRWLCREFNARHDAGCKLFNFSVYEVAERAQLDTEPTVDSPVLRWTYSCFDEAVALSPEEIRCPDKNK
jgi:hypothetical protein